MKTQFILVLTGISLMAGLVSAQTPYERLGQKAMTGGQFSAAAGYFEKAYQEDRSNMNALWLMGYSNYHAAAYEKCINAFNRLLAMKPTETAAYYYRGKAKVLYAATFKDAKSTDRENLLCGAIKDFTSALDLTPNDYKLLQNRGLAYQEYALYKSQKIPDVYNKSVAINACNSSIADFNKVLEESGFKRDITAQIEKSKQLLADIR
ncbi:MAG TPA: hypothetical protein VF273_06350 [Pelobium sp.]